VKRSTPLTKIGGQPWGVSTSTVSRALRRPELVREETRAAVMAAAEKAGYPVAAGDHAARARLENIGLVVPDIENPFFGGAGEVGAQRVAAQRRQPHRRGHNEEPLGEGEVVSTMLPRVDGIIIASSQAR